MPATTETRERRAERRARWLAAVVAAVIAGTGVARAQPVPTSRITARVDAGWRPASRTFASTTTFEAFSELASFEADYEIDEGAVVDGGISVLLWRNLAVGLDVGSYRSVNRAELTTQLPHPFFFDLPRTTTATAGGLERQELGVHLRALWMMQLTEWLVVSVSGGPSLINTRQDLVSAVQHREVGFPFDTVIFAGHTETAQSENSLGMNAGIDADFYVLHRLPLLRGYDVTRRMGLGVLLRYVRASTGFTAGDTPVEVDVGGLQVTLGLRYRF